jgi:hypothetical protein
MSDRPHISTVQAPAPQHADPAAANVSWEWIDDVLTPLGLTVLVIEAYSKPDEACPWLNESIGPKMEAAHVGSFDSYKVGNPICFFFYVRPGRIADALQIVFAELASAGIRQQCKVGYADQVAKVWRTALEMGGHQ